MEKAQSVMALGKARDVSESIAKAVDDAKKNLIKVPILQWYNFLMSRKADMVQVRF